MCGDVYDESPQTVHECRELRHVRRFFYVYTAVDRSHMRSYVGNPREQFQTNRHTRKNTTVKTATGKAARHRTEQRSVETARDKTGSAKTAQHQNEQPWNSKHIVGEWYIDNHFVAVNIFIF